MENDDKRLKEIAASLPERQKKILALVQGQGYASIEALSIEFDVTPQTIRRDMKNLCDLDLLKRYHGGAALGSSVQNLPYTDRQAICSEEKVRIARMLASHIPDNASIFINIGTSTEAVAKELLGHTGLRVITNNLHVAMIMSENTDFEIIITGGILRNRDLGITGEATIDFIRQFRADYAIIGISGIDHDGSLLDFDFHEVRVTKAIMENARKVFMIADHTKFGRSALVKLGEISEITSVFTNDELQPHFMNLLKETGIQIFIAKQ
ncbi:DeoR/GlpR family DNA-binding transcription regulator [Desulforegula conservatrix]|uniref:DeoR/GlpR family DNA-binding transcription regulator n=1 Tax=Desulforegula conservatrix TaxID=153026 RepID=UPI00041E3701|nr:DeoR family transcriptional regulator [Desulforegula conservatrix]